MAIRYIVCLNRQGVVRLARWYEQEKSLNPREISDMFSKLYRLVISREHKRQANFVEFDHETKLVYQRYAGLYFVLGVDMRDEEPIYLAQIHLFVETLDSFFGNVCELDLVFHFPKVYMVLDELFLAGEVQEISKDALLERLSQLDRLQ